jgi:hypothetical protein
MGVLILMILVRAAGVFAASDLSSYGGYNVFSCLMSIESHVQLQHRYHHWKKHLPNCLYCKDSVKLSSLYRYSLRLGLTRDLTHQLSSSDHFGEFRSLFRIALSKVEALTDIFINQGYIQEPRLLKFQEEFREPAELFVMSVLYRLGTDNSFCTCQSLCNISVSKIRLFFFVFIGAMVDMKEEYIFLHWNIAELQRRNKYYDDVGLSGCCGLMDVVHVKWSSCQTGDHNCAKGKADYPTLAFQCITNFNCRVVGIYGPQFGTPKDKEIVKVDPNVHRI